MSIDKFKEASVIHDVSENGPHFSIRPISESEIDIRDFQKLAKEAAAYVGEDFDVEVHETSRFGTGVIDRVLFVAK